MLRVGLTGNAGSGKSTVAGLFRSWGAALIDADQLAREVVRPGTPALAAIVERFGGDLLRPDGTLDRGLLRRRTMGDEASRSVLEAIVHPEVQALRSAREAAMESDGAAILVHEVPLLFEVLDPADFDVVVTVDAPERLRRERLIRHRGLTGGEADVLMAAQQPAAGKRARSDFVIDNDGGMEQLETAAAGVWRELQRRAGLG